MRFLLTLLFVFTIGPCAVAGAAGQSRTIVENEPGKCAASRARDVYLSGYLPVDGVKPVTTATFRGAANSVHSITNWKGHAVLLNVWVTWCPPCVKELPALNRLKVALRDRGIDIVVVNEDLTSSTAVAAFLAKVDATALSPYWDPGRSFMKAARIASLPTTLLIDSHGHEIAAVLQDADWDDPGIMRFIASCLSGEPQSSSSGIKTSGSP